MYKYQPHKRRENKMNMVFKYKRKSERGSTWTETSMEHALQAVRNGESIRKASLTFHSQRSLSM
ncbi:unnamed protein product [Acanthoscelides obtectus]|uniref:HTH psq-type domain-containing protein n=1 Tax=Acanthoscelides obtectus TaxID=200917 RepID=A0A9P0JMJ7_ACAOB|nr:unnamed protein product [Acanthoscelides obtectus]CAK1634751.1 hypothetical protein AOBTE_LOCUS8884 [Acanthoscelides obtectus]